MKRKWIACIAALALVGMSVACSGSKTTETTTKAGGAAETTTAAKESTTEKAPETSAAPAAEMTIGFVVKSLADQYWVLVKAGAEEEAAKEGVKLKFIAPNSESDVQSQVEMLDTLVAEGVSALCVAPSSQDAVLPALEKATAANIPVLAVDTDTTYAKKLSFIGTGNEAAAKMGAEYAAKELGSGKKAIILRGRLGDTTHDDRVKGLEDGLKAGGIEILEIKAADSEAEKGLNIMQDLLTKYEQIDLVITTADSMAQGAQRAVEAAGAATKIMGFDGTIPVAKLVAEGKVLGTTAQNPYQMGILGVQNAVKAAKGETIEARIDSGATVVAKDNADSFVKDLEAKAAKAK